ncbi:unnamed protein product [Didymodactylos carnosus]|uniref:Protein kinase domain-containing protein n=1 Tax=Didymodactylos carnosus TaxID=1234261 RepID=A0A815H6N9_9BILA|nr:unnamed protein product [Didymodactylos carnosus]CAF4219248.1 unnamed protein product [Didymodactylos carnosus]
MQLVVCGYNSAGKTSFLHSFLKYGAFLPTGDGAVTGRIVKFSYASPDERLSKNIWNVQRTTFYQHSRATQQATQQGAIDRIIQFAAEHDLQGTKYVSKIMLDAIDAFFDFVLVTNRRSPVEWDRLREQALNWSDEFFHQYRAKIDTMAKDIEVHVLQKFHERRDRMEENAFITYKKGWYTPAKFLMKMCPNYSIPEHDELANERKRIIYSAVEEEVVRPVLKQIISKMNIEMKQLTIEQSTVVLSTKNELLCAAFHEVLTNSVDLSKLFTVCSYNFDRIFTEIMCFVLSSVLFARLVALRVQFSLLGIHHDNEIRKEQNQKNAIRHCLVDVEDHLSNISELMEPKLRKWLDDNRKQFKLKVDTYHNIVQKTKQRREKAYKLSRTFSGRFARIECRLVANLDLAKHHGTEPMIGSESLGQGGFFIVHPASWGVNQQLVAKIPRDPVTYPDMVYLEAHFHRTITRLRIEHMVPLRYLFEKEEQQAQAAASVEQKQLFILLPRYRTNLRTYLVTNICNISIDRVVQIVLDIARVIAHMHSYELVHRDVKTLNILLDDHEQVYLADFGTCQHGTENVTVIGSRPFAPELSSDHQFSYDGAALDVYSLGILMYVVTPKRTYVELTRPITETDVNSLDQTLVPDSFRQLILRCVDVDPKKRLTVSQVVQELENIANQVANSRPCLVCLDQPRYRRCLPCGHKTMCNTCLTQRQQTNPMSECILCRKVFTSTQEDANMHTIEASGTKLAE